MNLEPAQLAPDQTFRASLVHACDVQHADSLRLLCLLRLLLQSLRSR
jgi:hypothetical protein